MKTKMACKVAIFVVTLLVGSLAKPIEEDDMSIFFDHTNADARIVGGVKAGTVPWMVALSNGVMIKNFVCGASIITNRHFLTAAHCIQAVYDKGLSRTLRATVGTNRWMSGGVHYNISKNITHQHYVHANIKNDIGILVSASTIRFTKVIAPAVLNYKAVGTRVATTVNGWGHKRVNGAISETLLELQSITVGGEFCKKEVLRIGKQFNIRTPDVDPRLEICTLHSVNHGTCNGDSGSALVRSDNKQQIGIVSWGIICARGAPDMFVRISAYRSWIERALL